MRKHALSSSLLALCLLAACGGESDDPDTASDTNDVATASVDDVRTCLESSGLSLSESESFTDEVKKGLGIVETFTIEGDGEQAGLGGIAWYKDRSTASDAHKAASAVRTDDVARELVGTVSYHFAGANADISESVGASIKDCLQ